MPQSAIDQEKLRQGLLEDLKQGQAIVEGGAAARGVSTPPQAEPMSFMPRAVRLQEKVVGEAELATLDRTIKETIDKLASTSDFANRTEQALFKQSLQQRFNQFKLQMIRSGGQLDMHLARSKYDQAQRQALIASFAGVASAAGQGVAIKNWHSDYKTALYATQPKYGNFRPQYTEYEAE